MKKTLCGLTFAVLFSSPALAIECKDVVWHQDVLDKYPSIANACQSVITKNGQTFVEVQAKFVRYRAPNHAVIDVVENNGTNERQIIKVPANATVNAGGQPVAWEDLPQGYKLHFTIPSDRFEVAKVPPVTVTILPAIISYEEIRELPKTAAIWPAIGAIGVAMLALAQLIGFRRRQQK